MTNRGPSSSRVRKRASHPCTLCHKCFTKRSNMLIHRRVHTGEMPYVCKYAGCGKRFKWLSSINFHQGICPNMSAGLANPAPQPPPPPAAAEAARLAASSNTPPTPLPALPVSTPTQHRDIHLPPLPHISDHHLSHLSPMAAAAAAAVQQQQQQQPPPHQSIQSSLQPSSFHSSFQSSFHSSLQPTAPQYQSSAPMQLPSYSALLSSNQRQTMPPHPDTYAPLPPPLRYPTQHQQQQQQQQEALTRGMSSLPSVEQQFEASNFPSTTPPPPPSLHNFQSPPKRFRAQIPMSPVTPARRLGVIHDRTPSISTTLGSVDSDLNEKNRPVAVGDIGVFKFSEEDFSMPSHMGVLEDITPAAAGAPQDVFQVAESAEHSNLAIF